MKPDPRTNREFTVCDPAIGTGEFLVASYQWFLDQTGGGAIDRDLAMRLKKQTYFGQDLVPRPRRLALMNLYLHGLEPHVTLGDSIYEVPSGRRFDVILTNPPFGTKGSGQMPEREDFVISTSNKQLNFLQHVMTTLKSGGRAAVVVPDNCLFADQAGEVFKIITEDCDLHTVVRLPNGTFTPYSPGTKTNVVFFTKAISTETVWVYDARTNVAGITKKDRPLSAEHFAEFERATGQILTAVPSARRAVRPRGPATRAATAGTASRLRKFASATTRSTASNGSRMKPSTTVTICCHPRSWPLTPSGNWRRRWRT